MAKNSDNGIVYLLTNECMPGLVKIGMTSRKDLDNRLKELEQALHSAFEPQRVNPAREFFRIKPSQAIGILKLFDKGNITRCPSIDFLEMGLQVGDLLVYNHDNSVTCKVAGSKKVEFEGEQTSLTRVTTRLLNAKWSVQPTPHWSFGGRNLSELYEEWQQSENEEHDSE